MCEGVRVEAAGFTFMVGGLVEQGRRGGPGRKIMLGVKGAPCMMVIGRGDSRKRGILRTLRRGVRGVSVNSRERLIVFFFM